MRLPIILILLAITLIAGCAQQPLPVVLSSIDIKDFNISWYKEEKAYWTPICEACRATKQCNNRFKYTVAINLPSGIDIAKCKWLYNNLKYPLQDSAFLEFPETSTDEISSFSLMLNQDNYVTLCCGINDYNETCKSITLPAKCL